MHLNLSHCFLVFALSATFSSPPVCRGAGGTPSEISAAHFPSIQAALDAHPGRVIRVPDSDYQLDQPIVIQHTGSGLSGYGRLIQTNPKAAIIEIVGAADVRLRGLTLMRPAETETAEASAIDARNSAHLSLADLRVINNRAARPAVRLQNCRNATLTGSRIENYSAISIDDRTASPHYGYAFNCIDGGHLVVNNIIADFGYGDSWWIWNQDGVTRAPLLFDRGQEPDDPPLRDVIVSGNVIRTLSAEPGTGGQPLHRYRYAVWVDPGTNGPVGLHFSGNLFPPGRDGVSNVKLENASPNRP